MITELGPPGLSRGVCVCVGGGEPRGRRAGGTSHLCSEHASCSSARWGSPPGEWAVIRRFVLVLL